MANTERWDERNILLRFAALSDLHIGESPAAQANRRFVRALDRLYAAAGGRLDALLVAGDITDWGTDWQIREFARIIRECLRPETVLTAAIGNHDIHDNRFDSGLGGERFFAALGDRMYSDPTAEELEAGNSRRTIRGFRFLTLGLRNYTSGRHEEADLAWLRRELTAAGEELPGKPVFLATHPVLQNTVFGSDEGAYWHSDNLASVLRDFPETVVFSGHLHFPLNDERSIYQDGYTAVGTAAVYYGSLNPLVDGVPCAEISGMEPYDCEGISQALLVEVNREGQVRIRRWDLLRDEEIRRPWVFRPGGAEQPYSPAVRTENNRPPAFPPETAVRVDVLSGQALTLSFPAAQDDDQVFCYEVTLTARGGESIARVMTYSDFYRVPRKEDMASVVTRTLTAKRLGMERLEEPFRLSVRARDSFGLYSPPIAGQPDEQTRRFAAAACIPTRLEGTDCRPLYCFDFWTPGRHIGGITDDSAYLGIADGAEAEYRVEAVSYGPAGRTAMQVTALSCWPEGFRTLTLKVEHPENPGNAETYPGGTALSFFVDAADWPGELELFPMLSEQDYTPDGEPAGQSLFAPRAAFRFLIEGEDRLIRREGAGHIRLPEGYGGRVYLPLDRENVEPIWGTRDENGRFDGRQVSGLRLALAGPRVPGGRFVMQDIGIHVPQRGNGGTSAGQKA